MHVIDNDPAEAKRALEHISRTSRSSLAEIRRLLGLVRAGEGASAYAPVPSLADLPRLADEVAGAGLRVDLEVAPHAGVVPPGVELAAYRIVQEALTNTIRHAGAAHAIVQIDVEAGRLHIVVSDDGRGRNGGRGGGGHGLIGMRERVAVYGGSLDVGPAPGGGFRIEATLPYDEEPS
jgi:signal transduction histidine kinase